MLETLQSPLFPWYTFFTILSFCFGACIGSFLNVCIYRIPRELSVVAPRSFCPHCNKPIPWYYNIPILTYMMLRGKSKCCRKEIQFRYVLVEILTAILFLFIWLKFDNQPGSRIFCFSPITDWRLIPVYWLVVSGLVLGTFVDFEHLIIPDRVTIGGIISGLIISVALPSLHTENNHFLSLAFALLGAIVGGGILWGLGLLGKFIFHKEAMGFGDVKLLAGIGAFLGTKAVLFNVLVSSFIGSVAGISFVLAKCKKMRDRIPYGPYIALAAIIWILWGSSIWDAYMNLLFPADVSTGLDLLPQNTPIYIN